MNKIKCNRVEKHVIRESHPAFNQIDQLSFKCKNLYNYVLYSYRQILFKNNELYKDGLEQIKYPSNYDINKAIKHEDVFKDIGNTKLSQAIVKQVNDDWFNWLKALKAYYKSPDNFLGKPKVPKYKDKVDGRNLIRFSYQAISSKSLRKGFIKCSQIDYEFKMINSGTVKQVDIVPNNGNYDLIIIYEKIIDFVPNPDENGELFDCGIDLGLTLLASVATTKGKGALVDGRPLKHINYLYNRLIDESKSKLPKGVYTSKKINRLYNRRNNKVKNYLHKASRKLVDYLHSENIGNVYIGNNKGWKQEINIGKKNNRAFTQIPFDTFISMIQYKSEERGIITKKVEEAYTSKASAVDKDQLFKYGKKPKEYEFSGNRSKRGLYVSKKGINAHADCNGAFNILRKGNPNVDNLKDYHMLAIGCLVRPEYIRFDV